MGADGLANDEGAGIFERLANFFAAGHFADAGAPGTVGQDQQVAGEERAVSAAQVQQHAVAASHGDDAQGGDQGCGVSRHGLAKKWNQFTKVG